ncbi:ATP-binding protein [Nonomuraea roseoviolacea subsp. roseoviolacea]
MPIRVRLLVVYLVASTVLAVSGGIVFERQLRDGLITSMDTALQARAGEIAQVVPEAGTELNFQDEPERLTSSRATFAQIFAPSGELVEASEATGRRPLLNAAELATARRSAGYLTRRLNGEVLRLRAEPVARPTGKWTIVVGGSLEPSQSAIARVRRDLLAAVAGLVLLGTAGVWLLAGTALRPVERMRLAAEDMHVRDPASRLEVPATRDEIARLGHTFNDLLARLQEAMRRQRRFVAEAGHELRSPLAVLQAELELAAKPGRSRAELAAAVDNAAEESRRLSRLADNLLFLAQSDEGVPLARPQRLPLAPILSRAVDAVTKRACRRAVGLRVDAPAGITADIDPDRLRQALDNLLDNALRATPPGGDIIVRARRQDGRILIEVIDSGPGFLEGFLPSAFERFRRADNTRTRDGEGAGLGLAIVQAVAEAHEGSAEAANQPASAGAVVRIILPR